MPVLFLALAAFPFLELYLLFKIGEAIGFWQTIGMLILAGFLGGALVRVEGFRLLNQVRATLARGEVPTDAVLHGLMISVGGMLLILPGVISDALGLFLLLPWTRSLLVKATLNWIQKQIDKGKILVTGWGAAMNNAMNERRDVIDVEAVEIPPKQIANSSRPPDN